MKIRIILFFIILLTIAQACFAQDRYHASWQIHEKGLVTEIIGIPNMENSSVSSSILCFGFIDDAVIYVSLLDRSPILPRVDLMGEGGVLRSFEGILKRIPASLSGSYPGNHGGEYHTVAFLGVTAESFLIELVNSGVLNIQLHSSSSDIDELFPARYDLEYFPIFMSGRWYETDPK